MATKNSRVNFTAWPTIVTSGRLYHFVDKEGKLYSVRYDQVNAMLLNEFLKEHKAFVEEQHKVKEQEPQFRGWNSKLKRLRPACRK